MIFTATTWIIPVLLAITLHEAAHAYAAWRLGDDTAYRLGRVTFNPIKHVDLFGTVLLPALLFITKAPFLFGWAKPVPVNPGRFTNPTGHMAITAIAGPASNLVLATLLARLALPSLSGIPEEILGVFIVLNVFLAVFNMLPIPPLDGSRLLPLVLPERGRQLFHQLEQFGFIILFALLFFVEGSLDFMTDWVRWLLRVVVVG